MLPYVGVFLFGVFISSVSQVLLKKAAQKDYPNAIAQYLNPLVVFAYAIFLASTLLSVLAYSKIPLSLGPVLEATGYLYITAFGVLIFKEHLTKKKVLALGLIVAGICIYAL